MKKLLVSVAFLSALLVVQTALAQGNVPFDPSNSPPDFVRRNDERRKSLDKLNGKDDRGMIANRENLRRANLPRTKRDKPYTKEELAQLEALKRPSEADLAVYADFLEKKGTGMFRLFPYLNCTEKGLIRIDGECADYVFDSWTYSFRSKDYRESRFLDIKYEDGHLVTGSLLSLGILTPLGDVPVEKVTLTSDGMKFLADLKPETDYQETEKQFNSFAKGVEDGGFTYSSKTKIEEPMTYGLRVVAYRMPIKVQLFLGDDPAFNNQNLKFSYPINEFDKRDDIIVAFRIIRKEKDGNVTIVWKELSRTDAPKLVFPKDIKKVIVN